IRDSRSRIASAAGGLPISPETFRADPGLRLLYYSSRAEIEAGRAPWQALVAETGSPRGPERCPRLPLLAPKPDRETPCRSSNRSADSCFRYTSRLTGDGRWSAEERMQT